MVYHIILADILLIARIFPRPCEARKNTTQLAKYPRVLYDKPSNKIYLSYDPYGPARAFIAKLLRKSSYERRTRWRERGRKKPSGPARIAYGPHTGILSIARGRYKLKQLCCYINPDFSVKMSDLREHYEFDYPKKKITIIKKGKAWWSYDKMLID